MLPYAPVITITFNPALDKTASIEAMLPEKKLRCQLPVLSPGGGGVNVSRSLHELGGHTHAIFLAGGTNGERLQKLLQEEGVLYTAVPMAAHTREDLTITDNDSGLQYRFTLPGEPVTQKEWEACLTVAEALIPAVYLVVSGSLPPGIPLNIFDKLSVLAKEKRTHLVVDTSGEALQAAVNAGVYMLKCNIHELGILTGNPGLQPGQAPAAARQLINLGACEMVVVSLGARGALLVTKDLIHTEPAPMVHVKSTVGAGDSMLAGMLYGLLHGMTLPHALTYGVAAGTAATMRPGTSLCRKTDVESLLSVTGNAIYKHQNG